MDVRTVVGYTVIISVFAYYFWMMQRQLHKLRQGRRLGTIFGHLKGLGALLYNLLETAFISAASFFALHVGYVLVQGYRLENMKYGLASIGIGILGLTIGRYLLLLLRVGPSYSGRVLATGWVSILSAMLAFGVWVIVITEGNVLQFQVPEPAFNLLFAALIPIITFIAWMVLAYSHTE